MELHLSKLQVDKEKLTDIVDAFRKLRARVLLIESSNDLLTIYGWNDGRRNHTTLDQMVVKIPYLGEEGLHYVKVERFLDHLHEPGRIIPLEDFISAQPLGWLEPPNTPVRVRTQEFELEKYQPLIKFLLRLNPGRTTDPSGSAGIIVEGNEWLTTQETRSHVVLGMPTLTNEPSIIGIDATKAFFHATKSLEAGGAFQVGHKGDAFYLMSDDSFDAEVTVVSKSRLAPTRRRPPRHPLTQNSIGFTVHQSFIEEVARFTRQRAHGVPVVFMRAEDGELEYWSLDQTEKGEEQLSHGSLPLVWSTQSQAELRFRLPADQLFDAIRDFGDRVQFFFPEEEQYWQKPVYLNGSNPNLLALLTPI